MKMREIAKRQDQKMRVEGIQLTQRAEDLIARRVAAVAPREYAASDLVKIVDKNDVEVAKGNYKSWSEVLAGVSERYGLSI